MQDADLLVFVIPHQFIHRICDEITGRVPKKALGITLIKVTRASDPRRGSIAGVWLQGSFMASHFRLLEIGSEREVMEVLCFLVVFFFLKMPRR